MASVAAHVRQVFVYVKTMCLQACMMPVPHRYHSVPGSGRIRSQRGFALTEILVTVVLLSIAFLGLSALMLGTIRGVSRSNSITTATTLARDKTEQVIHADYDTVIPANYPLEDYNTMAGHERFQRSVAITDNAPQVRMKTILVTVSWKDERAQTHALTLTSTINQQ
jgi:prepilin-type N-terminal cleavage/methylation domain-containing protein